jgi:hypothetical protein
MKVNIFMFKKLNLPKLDLSVDSLQGMKRYHSNAFTEYLIKHKFNFYINVIKKLNFKIKPSNFNLTKISYPGSNFHTDAWPVALNYYLSPSDDTTHFWKTKQDTVRNSTTKPTGFCISELTWTNSFVAKINDWYLLNTKEIHNVEMNKDSSPRFILRFVWNMNTYEEILNSFSEYQTF